MEAARIAALRGHRTTVMEKEAEPGGKLRILGLCEGNDLYLALRDWLVGQCTKAGVHFEFGVEVTPQVIDEAKPDAVILATGAPIPIIPRIAGIERSHVVYPEDVLSGRVKVGKHVVVIGGGQIGVDTAYTIAAKDLAERITIVETEPVSEFAYDMSVLNRTYMLMVLLPRYEVDGFSSMRIKEIAEKKVVMLNRDGKRKVVKSDTVILAFGYRSKGVLLEALKSKNREFYAIGDCVKARSVADAVQEGAKVGRQI